METKVIDLGKESCVKFIREYKDEYDIQIAHGKKYHIIQRSNTRPELKKARKMTNWQSSKMIQRVINQGKPNVKLESHIEFTNPPETFIELDYLTMWGITEWNIEVDGKPLEINLFNCTKILHENVWEYLKEVQAEFNRLSGAEKKT